MHRKFNLPLIVGLLLILGGLSLIFSTLKTVWDAQIGGIFYSIVSDNPTQRFTLLDCPNVMSANESGTISAEVLNSTNHDLVETFTIDLAGGFQRTDATPSRQVTIPSGQKQQMEWQIIAIRNGSAYATVTAISAEDAAKPNFHSWPTSYRQSCATGIIDPLFPPIGIACIIGGITAIIVSRRGRRAGGLSNEGKSR